MAIMLPGEVDPADLDHESEAPVYAALRDQLGNDYVVLHSYPWLRPDRDQVLAEGEADFLVVHRTKGLLVLEVKGGDVRHERGRWVRQTAAGPKSIKDPFEQARRNMHALVDIIKEHGGSDARFFQKKVIPCIINGIRKENSHGDNEKVYIPEIDLYEQFASEYIIQYHQKFIGLK